MRNWIFSIQSTTTILVLSGITTVCLWCGPNSTQEVRTSTETPSVVRSTEDQVADLVVDASLERSIRFQKLLAEWRKQRGAMSWVSEMVMCPAYQSIIGIGPSVIPLILAQLQSEGAEPDHWFWALRALTGANPVTANERGDIVRMARAWIEWGKSAGYAG